MDKPDIVYRQPAPLVYLLHGDPDLRHTLMRLLLQWPCPGMLATAEDLIEDRWPQRSACAVLDTRNLGPKPGAIQAHLSARTLPLPLVFVSDCADILTAVSAMKSGAVDFLSSPVSDAELDGALQRALERDRCQRAHAHHCDSVRRRYALLTPRERQVMARVVQGMMSKQAAFALSLSDITVKIHRANLMRKMQADSVVDLVRMSALLAEPNESKALPPRRGHHARIV